jgi:hypothetical protein
LNSKMKLGFLAALKKGAEKDDDVEVDMSDFEISEEETNIVELFLSKFTLVTENSLNDHLDIMLMIKALPNRITHHTLKTIEQFNFKII